MSETAHQQRDIDELRRLVVSTSIRMDLLELEVAMWKSEASRTKNAWKYAEEAVAAQYGIQVSEFRRRNNQPGRPKDDQSSDYKRAQQLLFSFLVNVIGENPESLRIAYGETVTRNMRFWGKLYNLVHTPRENLLKRSDPKQRKQDIAYWDLYAPMYQGAYEKWKAAMQADGVWPQEMEYELESEYA